MMTKFDVAMYRALQVLAVLWLLTKFVKWLLS